VPIAVKATHFPALTIFFFIEKFYHCFNKINLKLAMTITLTNEEWDELWGEPIHTIEQDFGSELPQVLWELPQQHGKGYWQKMDIHPELWLVFSDVEYQNDMLITSTGEGQHLLHFDVLLSGKVVTQQGQCGEGYTLICGGGIQNKTTAEVKKCQRLVQVSIEVSRDLLATYFPGKDGELLPELQQLFKDDDWHPVFYPKSTPAIHGVAQQIINCPWNGVTKQIYLQGKILELMALQLAPLLEDGKKKRTPPSLKLDTIARIHHASDILRSRLENPPSSLELAQIVGVSGRTLRRGFRELFGTTVFNYLTFMRMEQAERLLREGNRSVAEVANLVGYSHLGFFASVFKRQYGICPKQCLMGKKTIKTIS
jgi:AraC-like DNA-binding protein